MNDKLEYIKKEEKVVKKIKDLIHKSFYKGLSQGLYKAGQRGSYRLGPLEMNFGDQFGGFEDLTYEQINDLIIDLSEESRIEIQKLYNI